MAEDILNELLPNDNPQAPDINFKNDTTYGEQDPTTDPTIQPADEISQADSEGVATDLAILDALYPEPKKGEFIFGRNIEKGLTGVNSKDIGLTIGQIVLPTAPNIVENTQNVAGMYGQRWLGNNYGSKIFNIPVTMFSGRDESTYQKNIQNISNSLIALQNLEVPIIFGAFPDLTFFGHFTALPDFSFINPGKFDANSTLQFTASDPHGYLEQEYGVADNLNKLSLIPLGNDTAKPIYHYDFSADSNNFGYTNDKGEYVFVGYANDDNPKDTVKLVYHDPLEDNATFTKITDMGTQKWALANAKASTDGTMKVVGGSAISNDKFWTVPQNYTGQSTAFGNVLLTKKFNVGAAGNYILSTRLRHSRYYDRAYQRLEAYLIDSSGNKIGRLGMSDCGSGGLTHLYVLFGQTIAEEQVNLNSGFGYYGTGNTAWAKAQLVNAPQHRITIDTTTDVPNLTTDRQQETTTNQTFYTGDFNQNYKGNQFGVKWEREWKIVETWKTPRDANGNKLGSQQYKKETVSNTTHSTRVPINKLIKNQNNKISYTSTQDISKKFMVWGSTVGMTEGWWTWHNEWTWDERKKNHYWKCTKHNRGTWADANNKRKTETSTLTNKISELNYDDRSALTSFWGHFKLTKIGNKINVSVNQIDWNTGLETNNSVLDTDFNIPNGFNAQIAQVAYFFGKTPIHEDKITKTTTNEDGTKTYNYLKSYTDDNLTVTDLTVKSLVTADDLKKAHTIIHAGDTADIDTETENVYINGQLANQYLSPASTYPLLKGGKQEAISFFPAADLAKISYAYRPSMK